MDEAEKLISTIEKEESVWNIHSNDFLQRDLKVKAWRRIGQQLTSEWSELSPTDQEKSIAGIKKRWTHIKDYYKREKHLKKQYFSKRKSQIVNRRKYVFNDLLGFLEPTISVNKSYVTERLGSKVQSSSCVDNESSSSAAAEEATQNTYDATINMGVNTIAIKSEVSEDDEAFISQNEQQAQDISEQSLQPSSPTQNPNGSQSLNTIPQYNQLITPQPRLGVSEGLMNNVLPQRVQGHQITLSPPQRQDASDKAITSTPLLKERVPINFEQIAQPILSGTEHIMHAPHMTRERLSENLNRQSSPQLPATPSYLAANPNAAFLLSCVQEMDEMSSFQRIEFKSGVINLLKTIKYPS